MKINSISNFYSNYKTHSQNLGFCANNKIQNDSFTKTTFNYPEDVFFVRMKYYNNDINWARKMALLTSSISSSIKKQKNFNEVLAQTTQGINTINGDPYGQKRCSYGNFGITKNFSRGEEYFPKYFNKLKKANRSAISPKTNDEYKQAHTCVIKASEGIELQDDHIISIMYGWSPFNRKSNIEYSSDAYNKLRVIQNPTIDDINKCCATINWLIAQESPYQKGNDSIATTLSRAIYQSHNVMLSPLKKGVSLDFEAFDCDLDEYIKKYPNFFEKCPKF